MSSYPFISRPSRFSRSDYEDRPQCIVSVHAIARAELYKPFLFVAPGKLLQKPGLYFAFPKFQRGDDSSQEIDSYSLRNS